MLPAVRNPSCVVPNFMLRHCVRESDGGVSDVPPATRRPARAAEMAGMDPAAAMFGSVCHFIQDNGGRAWEIHVLTTASGGGSGALEVAGVVSRDTEEGIAGASRIRVT